MKLAKGIKVPTAVKAMAALMYPTNRTAERSYIRANAEAINANETKARSRGKDKKDDAAAK